MIDLAIQGTLLFVVGIAAGVLSEIGVDFGGLGAALLYVTLFLILFGYPAALETLWRGRTVGKAAMGLRVVTVEGGPVRFRHAAIRAILGLVDKYLLTGAIGIISVLLTRRNQRLGDLVAGTIVLRERSGARAPTAVSFAPPPGLEDYVASLDVAGLDHRDYAAVRSFLLRATSLSPSSRYSLANRLALPLLQRLRTAPPQGVHPELFLVCVAAAYQSAGRRRATGTGFASVWSDPHLGTGGAGGGGAGVPPIEPAAGGGFVAPT
ncbi:MAG: RDD family protein [Actinobacteria bacterium]|nr:RDD family protein [Actinomycetota bacterium]MBW3649888.1 RDD family protein [Actinomycetota bacterium]